MLQDGGYTIGFKDQKIGSVGKGTNVKLNAYFAGSATPVAITVKVAVG